MRTQDPLARVYPSRRQSEAAGIALAALNVEFAACYTSPKVRARETAELA